MLAAIPASDETNSAIYEPRNLQFLDLSNKIPLRLSNPSACVLLTINVQSSREREREREREKERERERERERNVPIEERRETMAQAVSRTPLAFYSEMCNKLIDANMRCVRSNALYSVTLTTPLLLVLIIRKNSIGMP